MTCPRPVRDLDVTERCDPARGDGGRAKSAGSHHRTTTPRCFVSAHRRCGARRGAGVEVRAAKPKRRIAEALWRNAAAEHSGGALRRSTPAERSAAWVRRTLGLGPKLKWIPRVAGNSQGCGGVLRWMVPLDGSAGWFRWMVPLDGSAAWARYMGPLHGSAAWVRCRHTVWRVSHCAVMVTPCALCRPPSHQSNHSR